jgi:hypothetical protein
VPRIDQKRIWPSSQAKDCVDSPSSWNEARPLPSWVEGCTLPGYRHGYGAPRARPQARSIAARAFGTVSFGLTLYQAPSIRPSAPIRKDDRMMPTEVFPYEVFSPHAP